MVHKVLFSPPLGFFVGFVRLKKEFCAGQRQKMKLKCQKNPGKQEMRHNININIQRVSRAIHVLESVIDAL